MYLIFKANDLKQKLNWGRLYLCVVFLSKLSHRRTFALRLIACKNGIGHNRESILLLKIRNSK